MKPTFPPLTVVIATLGGSSLQRTIEHLSCGSVVPNEILVCIPRDDIEKVAVLHSANVRVVATSERGQVAQRAVGFAQATNPFVLQLDDDMLVSRNCIEHLLCTIAGTSEKVAVAASLLNVSNGQPHYRAPRAGRLLWLYYWLLNGRVGYRPGTITLAGTNIGIDPTVRESATVPVEWVAGGCVMHRRENLLLHNFYPFKGKAYCEDLYHSYYLKQSGVQLVVSTNAECFVDDGMLFGVNLSFLVFLPAVRADFRARTRFVKLTQRSVTRMYFYYAALLCRYFAGRTKWLIGRVARA